ncbi:hypothetical protein [Rubripirellula reticaptiva]|uniref:Uncharacterized protein n=1 Tax=Rubripirellula reticaptiva TaxID=2528013 RepID=A0A5C6FF36_9BACT|nr:hypothetical protein [Rubripirellula reticaptiva]TWU58239.1 hypothetical protein Poly59_11500 [Rubripirellula reticaptiva]
MNRPPVSEPMPDEPAIAGRDRLDLSPAVWVAIAVVAFLGLRSALVNSSSNAVLNYRGRGEWIPIRSSDSPQVFTSLGVQVNLPIGWTYLAQTDNDRAVRPTFVNESRRCIVKLFPAPGRDLFESVAVVPDLRADQANAEKMLESKNKGANQSATISDPRFAVSSARVRWAQVRQTIRIEVSDGNGGKLPLAWNQIDPRKIGQWSDGISQIGLVAIADPTDNRSSQAIDEFCARIEVLLQNSGSNIPLAPTLRIQQED